MADVTGKICIRCGQDCSGRPRVKDAQGRYCCRECAPGHAPVHGAASPAAEASPDAVPSADDLIPVEESESYKKTRAPCSRCGAAMILGVPACPKCGFDPSLLPDEVTKRKKPKRPKGLPTKCKECEHDLAGVPVSATGQVVCPECGGVNRVSLGRIDLQDVSREMARNAVTKPLWYLGSGIAATLLILGLQQEWLSMGYYAISYVVSVLLGLAVYAACSALWLGFNYTIPITGLAIAAVHAVVMAIHALLEPTPIPQWTVLALMGTCYSFLLADLMDIDPSDGWIVGAVEFIIICFVGFSVMWALGL